jgi:phosphoserine phosphatase
LSKPIEQKIEELNSQFIVLKQERDKLNDEAEIWAEKRDNTHKQIKDLRQQAADLREKRDNANKSVQELKDLREKAKTERSQKSVQMAKAKKKLRVLTDKKPLRDLSDIEKELEGLEWKIQTTSMAVKEEKELIERVKILETQRNLHKQLQQLKNTMAGLQTEEKKLEIKTKVTHEKLSELVKQSQEFHREMLETLTKARNLESEADASHQKYMETRQKANEAHQKCVLLLRQVEAFKLEIRKKEKEKQAQRQTELREETVKKVREKAQHGEKLTLQEFQLLAEGEVATEH